MFCGVDACRACTHTCAVKKRPLTSCNRSHCFGFLLLLKIEPQQALLTSVKPSKLPFMMDVDIIITPFQD